MSTNYFEQLEHARAREAERTMVFAALRQRQEHIPPQGLLVAILHLLGALR